MPGHPPCLNWHTAMFRLSPLIIPVLLSLFAPTPAFCQGVVNDISAGDRKNANCFFYSAAGVLFSLLCQIVHALTYSYTASHFSCRRPCGHNTIKIRSRTKPFAGITPSHHSPFIAHTSSTLLTIRNM